MKCIPRSVRPPGSAANLVMEIELVWGKMPPEVLTGRAAQKRNLTPDFALASPASLAAASTCALEIRART